MTTTAAHPSLDLDLDLALALERDQLADFTRSGFLRWGALLQEMEIIELRAEYDRVMRENASNNLAASRLEADAASSNDPTQMLQVMQMCERSLLFRKLIYDPRILGVVTQLIGQNVMLYHDQALMKPPFTGGAVHWHQDNGYWGCTPANLVSCWITLDDADEENGTMQVVPGSHLRLQSHVQHAQTIQQTIDITPDRSDIVIVDLPAGGCMFHHCQTLHYSAPNRSPRQRRAFAIHYMPAGTRDGQGRTMPVSWQRPLVSASLHQAQ
jgi:phytanoyl-CoA hydroxylase